MNPAGAAIQVDRLCKSFAGLPVLHDLTFALPAGETLAVIGPSGCGKSTLLYLLAGLEKPDSGTIAGAAAGRGLSFILQDYGLFPWKTVGENLALPLELRGASRAEQQKAVADMLHELGLGGLADRYPERLSGGQRQRVAIGRALITRPDILLMDEPFSSLDAITRRHLQTVVLRLWQRRRPTCVLVTHDVAEAVFLGKHVMVLHGHPAGRALWLDNPCFGDMNGRLSAPYLELTRQVFEALGGDVADDDALDAGADNGADSATDEWGNAGGQTREHP